MVAKKDAQFQSSLIGILKSFKKTIVMATDFNFDLIILLESCAEVFF